MIKDVLKNAQIYYSLSKNLQKGFEWLEQNDLKSLADGKYEILGNSVFATIQTYETKEDAKYEAHRKYIDIQYIISGKENIGVTELTNCSSVVEYDSDKDLEFFNINIKKEEFLELSEGQFLVLYPHDAHKPSLSIDNKSLVKKVVVKVALN